MKLADLGIARAMDATQITAEGKVIGTLPYMAPERLEAAGAGGPASDVYALAAVAYELLSGSPVDREVPGREHLADRQELAARWPNAPAAPFAVIMRGLSRDPARRQSSAGELVAELDDAVRRGEQETQPLTANLSRRQTRPMLSRAPGGSRSRWSRVGAALALTLVALAGLTAVGVALIGGDSGDGTPSKKGARAAKSTGDSGDSAGSQAAASQGSATTAPVAPVVEDQASAPSSSSSADGASLNAQGFSLINQGRAAEAVPILRQAVDSYPEGSTDLNYAYALYNLGNALRLSGHPEEAIPVLERRLLIPNQRSTVATELARARAEAGTG